MKNYRALLRGKDFLIEQDGQAKLTGFMTTRWLRASSAEDAELKAIDLVRRDESLSAISQNIEGHEIKPMIYLEELSTVGWWTYIRRSPGGGYTFFSKENEESYR